MEFTPIQTAIIHPGDDLTTAILEGLKDKEIELKDQDILLIASKIVSVAEGRIVELKDVRPSATATALAKQIDLDERQVELILQNADVVYGKVRKALLTLKDNFLIANAGIDKSNSPDGQVILWSINPQEKAEKIRTDILKQTGKHVGIVIVDSRTTPLRHGTSGVALAVAGFKPVKDYRQKKDLFGNSLQITLQNLADDLASGAHVLMGEADERTPVVLARNVPVEFTSEIDHSMAFIAADNCLYMKALKDGSHGRNKKHYHHL
jgi:coenzyme F420-0:L-glutamate ligase